MGDTIYGLSVKLYILRSMIFAVFIFEPIFNKKKESEKIDTLDTAV